MNSNRYEIKFVINEFQLAEVKYFINYNTIKNRFSERGVNSLYYDTVENLCVKDNLIGISKRKKFRLRWYNDNSIPSFEIKNKNGKVGNKRTFKLKNISNKTIEKTPIFKLNKIIFSELIEISRENIYLTNLIPQLRVSYDREYFETDEGFRVTIDKNIKFTQISQNKSVLFHKVIRHDEVVLELKFPKNLREEASKLIRNLNLTPKRNSKYLLGMAKLGFVTYI